MNNRYKYQDIIGSDSNESYYNSIIYPLLEPTIDDIYIKSSGGENLVNLAKKYYNNTQYWFILALTNNLGKGSFNIPNGMTIRIYDPNNVDKIFNKLKDIADERNY